MNDASRPDPEYGACADILPSFLQAINLIVDETARVLSHPVQLGYIVLPRGLGGYWALLDEVMHRLFDFYRYSSSPDNVEFEIIGHTRSAQYAYRLITPDDLNVPWAPDGREIWHNFGSPRHDEIFAEPEIYILMVNLERYYLEIAPFCVAFCGIPMCTTHLSDLGEKSLHLSDSSHLDDNSEVQIPLSREFDRAVSLLATGIRSFMENNTFPQQNELLSAVIVAGGASEVAMEALRLAARNALPFLDSARFHDNLDPAAVFSLGVAIPSRNNRLYDQRLDCDCSEEPRLDQEFPCNSSWIHLRSYQ